ncbi:hypothetical protein ACLESO_49230 [Pyxidicoccus sp. 3LG]
MKTPVTGPRTQPRPIETPEPVRPRNELKTPPTAPAARADKSGVSGFDAGKGRSPAVALNAPVTRPRPATSPRRAATPPSRT